MTIAKYFHSVSRPEDVFGPTLGLYNEKRYCVDKSLYQGCKVHVCGLDVYIFGFRMANDFFPVFYFYIRFFLKRDWYTRRFFGSHRAVGPYKSKCIERKRTCYSPPPYYVTEVATCYDYGGVDKLSLPLL